MMMMMMTIDFRQYYYSFVSMPFVFRLRVMILRPGRASGRRPCFD